mmetsp:Transcript_78760/g.218913  ORF Transcript_78760/g.218913 Transcript_78760/m.218913 type:complete len:287 (-) Transcript_78760:467-1327(-)
MPRSVAAAGAFADSPFAMGTAAAPPVARPRLIIGPLTTMNSEHAFNLSLASHPALSMLSARALTSCSSSTSSCSPPCNGPAVSSRFLHATSARSVSCASSASNLSDSSFASFCLRSASRLASSAFFFNSAACLARSLTFLMHSSAWLLKLSFCAPQFSSSFSKAASNSFNNSSILSSGALPQRFIACWTTAVARRCSWILVCSSNNFFCCSSTLFRCASFISSNFFCCAFRASWISSARFLCASCSDCWPNCCAGPAARRVIVWSTGPLMGTRHPLTGGVAVRPGW